MTRTLAIDPGSTESGWVIIDDVTRRPLVFGKDPNEDVLRKCYGYVLRQHEPTSSVIEMVASYGMAVGKDVFETCVWIGRFSEAMTDGLGDGLPERIYRRAVKLHFCHNGSAKDSNVRQALVDRFASGQPNHGKGTKAEPGWFYGFRADIWQAFALAVYAVDSREYPPF